MRARSLRASGLLTPPSRHAALAPATPIGPLFCIQCMQDEFIFHHQIRPSNIRHYRSSRRRDVNPLAAAISTAQSILTKAIPNPPPGISVDPLRIVGKELKFLTKNIRQLLGSGHPMLDKVAKYYTRSEGKQLRPLLVLLMSQATALTPQNPHRDSAPGAESSGPYASDPISSPLVLADVNPDTSPLTHPLALEAEEQDDNRTAKRSDNSSSSSNDEFGLVLPSQRRLAEITELIHTASLLHDDVIDNAVLRRSAASANLQFGNKMAVLAGDFLLGRASVALARLRNPEVTELMATVIANLIEGEFMQLKNTAQDEKNPVFTDGTIAYYLQKTYLKSASLISKSCRSAALLGNCASEVTEAAYAYGRNLGLAFQLVDDLLDYTISATELGKPAGADLELGLATAPLLFAWERFPELGTMVGRKFNREGDVETARELVAKSDGVEQTRTLAQGYANQAIAAIKDFPPCEAKDGLIAMCEKTMNRRK